MIYLKFPTYFNITYPQKNFKYYKIVNKKNEILNLLIDVSNGYCMYCGNLIKINNKIYAQIEHSIEKNNFDDGYLTNCKYNLSLACSFCNSSSKKKDIKKIKINNNYTCPENCNQICSEYKNNIDDYIKYNKIILMPYGIKNSNNDYYEILYDLLNFEFIPNNIKSYDNNDKEFINNHITRFRLNDSKYKPQDIIKVCEYVIENKKIPEEKIFFNIIADLFIKYLKDNNISGENLITLCDILLINSVT